MASVNTLKDKVVVILGVTGIVGSGAAHAFLSQGAVVVGVSRDQKKLDETKKSFGDLGKAFLSVVGQFDNEAHALKAATEVKKVLNNKPYDHVVSVMGFVRIAPGGPSQTKLADLTGSFEDCLYPHIIATSAFLGDLKKRPGASYTVVSGGFAHFCPDPTYWLASVKNAALNALNLGLAAETKDDAVRVNTMCIHFGVAAHGGDKNQLGMPADDTYRLGPAFTALAKSSQRGKVLCVNTIEDAEKLASSLQ